MSELNPKTEIPVDPDKHLPYSGIDYELERQANVMLGVDEGHSEVSDDRNRKRFEWRLERRDKRIGIEVGRFTAADFAAADIPGIDTYGQARAILTHYMETRARALAPSRAFDTGSGPAPIDCNANLDRWQLEMWAKSQSDETKAFLYALTLEGQVDRLDDRRPSPQKDTAAVLGVSQPMVSRWSADLYEAIDGGEDFTPARKRRAKRKK